MICFDDDGLIDIDAPICRQGLKTLLNQFNLVSLKGGGGGTIGRTKQNLVKPRLYLEPGFAVSISFQPARKMRIFDQLSARLQIKNRGE